MNIKILDCTLRDGGYVNNWNFSFKSIRDTLGALEESQIDIVECGYLNNKKGKSADSTLFSDLEAVDSHLKNIGVSSEKVIMINLGDYDVVDLRPKHETCIGGIRFAFHKKDLAKALIQGKKIIELGYKLYFQPMVTKNYTDIEFLSMIEEVNILLPYAFYIVDSFGSMTLSEFNRYLVLSNHNLQSTITLGYHSHNNMQLAFSNAINMCNANFERDIIVDASIYGIGRGAGNLNTELIVDYLNSTFNANYKILPLLEIIDESLASLMQQKSWGFSPAQYLSASFDCHPNYASYLINKNTNHIVGIQRVLSRLSLENKASFDEETIENLYIDSILESKTDPVGGLDIPSNKKILLVASGKSIEEYEDTMKSKMNNQDYISIALNHKPKFECDYYFFSNQKRYDEFRELLPVEKIVITSNLLGVDSKIVLDIKKLVYVEDAFVSNVAIVSINYLITQKASIVEIAGLDGYVLDGDNYNYEETSVIRDNGELMNQNLILSNSLKRLRNKIDIRYITPTIFEKDLEQ